MFKYIQLILSMTLFSVFAQTSFAETKGNSQLFVGHRTEKVEITIVLSSHWHEDGVTKLTPPVDCEMSFTIVATGENGNTESIPVETVSLGYTKITMDYVDFIPGDSGYMLLRIEDVRKKGPCRLLSNLRQVDGDGKTVYSVGNDAPLQSFNFLQVQGL